MEVRVCQEERHYKQRPADGLPIESGQNLAKRPTPEEGNGNARVKA